MCISASIVSVTVSVSAILEAYDKFQLIRPTVNFIKILSEILELFPAQDRRTEGQR